MVTYTYESWLAVQKTRRLRLDGKQRRLNVVKSDVELLELSGSSLEAIQHQAQALLNQFEAAPETQATPNAKKRKKAHSRLTFPPRVA